MSFVSGSVSELKRTILFCVLAYYSNLRPATIATAPNIKYGSHESFISRKNGAVIAPIRAAAEPVAVPIDLTEVGYSSHA